MTREEWLQSAVTLIRPWYEGIEFPLPDRLEVACSWPSKNALTVARRRIGECWVSTAAKDKSSQIFISPLLSDNIEVLGTLVHEGIHAADDCKHGHNHVFGRYARKLGLMGKMTATVAGDELRLKLDQVVKDIGESYPHAGMQEQRNKLMRTIPKDGTRLIKVTCKNCKYVCRVTKKWLESIGAPVCPCNSEPMVWKEAA